MDETLTLAFDLMALQRLRDPNVVFEECSEWAKAVGIVASADPPAVSKVIRDAGLEPDFRSGPGDFTAAVLRDVAETFDTESGVLVGTTENHRSIAQRAGWRYQPVAEIAETNGWRLQYAPPEPESPSFPDEEWP